MTRYIDPTFFPDRLMEAQGYSLQVFTSGRYKLSLHMSPTQRLEYYGERPRRHREAYQKQRQRSFEGLPQHFAMVDALAEPIWCFIHRVHLKGDNNATADNAHIVTDTDSQTAHVLLGELHHQWVLPEQVIRALMVADGPRRKAPSCFNEYMASYEHDWMDAVFELADYRKGHRRVQAPQPAHTPHQRSAPSPVAYDDDSDLDF